MDRCKPSPGCGDPLYDRLWLPVRPFTWLLMAPTRWLYALAGGATIAGIVIPVYALFLHFLSLLI